jgi:uncharacterized membrane protein HdeD (DUF308 family)
VNLDELVPDVVVAIGLGCLVVGVGLWSIPAALIVGGVIVATIGILWIVGGISEVFEDEEEEAE